MIDYPALLDSLRICEDQLSGEIRGMSFHPYPEYDHLLSAMYYVLKTRESLEAAEASA